MPYDLPTEPKLKKAPSKGSAKTGKAKLQTSASQAKATYKKPTNAPAKANNKTLNLPKAERTYTSTTSFSSSFDLLYICLIFLFFHYFCFVCFSNIVSKYRYTEFVTTTKASSPLLQWSFPSPSSIPLRLLSLHTLPPPLFRTAPTETARRRRGEERGEGRREGRGAEEEGG